MNSIEQFWGNKKPKTNQLANKVDEERSIDSAKVALHKSKSAFVKEDLEETIWLLLVEEGEYLDEVARTLQDSLSEGDYEVADIIRKYVRLGAKIVTSDGIMDSFMLENLDRLINWQMATVHYGKDYVFSQSPIMKEILFNTDTGYYALETVSDYVQDNSIVTLVGKYMEM